MDKTEEINNEIKQLKTVLTKIATTKISKQSASDLSSLMRIFNHTFTVRFPISIKHYEKNCSNEIDVTDGLEDIEQYSESKLKQKDDHYFWNGKEKLSNGIKGIIRDLENDIKSNSL